MKARPTDRDQLTPEDYKALASFRLAVRRYLAFAEGGARAAGLTSQQHQALLAIKAHTLSGPMSIGELAGQLLIRHHSAAELVGRLERAGYTRRDGDPADGRRVLVSLTDTGEATLAQLSANNLAELRIISPAFSELLERVGELEGVCAAS